MRSALHDALTEKAKTWLAYKMTPRGLCWATEVSTGSGYVADAIGLGCLQRRFAEFYLKGLYTYTEIALIVDSKVSLSDYQNSKPAKGIAVGNLHWIVAPKGIFIRDQIIDPWGLLEVSGIGLREVKKPIYVAGRDDLVYRIAYSILWANRHEGRRRRQKSFRDSIKNYA